MTEKSENPAAPLVEGGERVIEEEYSEPRGEDRLLKFPFPDPQHDRELTLVVDPDSDLFMALWVEHPEPGCQLLAVVSADLDAFYCAGCRWQGRISGAWAFEKWNEAQKNVV